MTILKEGTRYGGDPSPRTPSALRAHVLPRAQRAVLDGVHHGQQRGQSGCREGPGNSQAPRRLGHRSGVAQG